VWWGGKGEGYVTIEGKKRDMSRKRELLHLLFYGTLSHALLTLLSLARFVLIDFGCF
jgi:hypothetical protein